MSPRQKPDPESQLERRGHPALKYNQKLAEQFGIQPAIEIPEAPRELVRVDYLPDPPDVEKPEAPDRVTNTVDGNPEDRIVTVLREEMEELSARLARFGVAFNSSQQQAMIDYGISVLGGYVGGGAIARRQ